MKLGFHKTEGLLLIEELKTIPKKSKNHLQPVFEAIMNSFESIDNLSKGEITIEIHIHKDLFTDKDGKTQTEKCYFKSITVSDNGVGFNDKEFKRFYTLRDNSKNKNNKGTGRIQYLHYFESTQFVSTYNDTHSKTNFKQCVFTLSKSARYLSENALVYVEKDDDAALEMAGTTVTFTRPFDEKDADTFANISVDEIKEQIIKYFLNYFCENRAFLPYISIKRIIDNEIDMSTLISENDIPVPQSTEPFFVNYSILKDNQIEVLDRKEDFIVSVFLIEDNKLKQNNIVLTSKGTEAKKYDIESLLPSEKINGNRYLALVSGNYIDNKDSDIRGDIKILTAEQYKEQYKGNLAADEVILLDALLKSTNEKLRSICPEIQDKFNEKRKSIEELKKRVLPVNSQ
jgi:hypothetical protein